MPDKKNSDDVVIVAEFGINELFGIGMGFVVLGIGLAYGMNVLGDVRTDLQPSGFNASDSSTWSVDYNASTDSINAVAKIPNKLGLIVTVIIASVIIGILVSYLYVRFK